MPGCQHTVTMGREGEKGSWCEACGVKVMAVHDRPCGECRHYRAQTLAARANNTLGTCRRHLMSCTSNMHVTYYVTDIERSGHYGLCFEPVNS